MKKTTQSASIKVRWLGYRSIILLLLFAYLPYLNLNAQTFSYTGAVQTVTLPAGSYEIEMWGANGGDAKAGIGGKGGYSKGILNIASSTTYYLYVGGKGATASAPTTGGWNGGGGFLGTFSTGSDGGTGGGGTDIRTSQNTAYTSRIIVAGGGGGAVGYTTYLGNGGNGGGVNGETGGSSRGVTYAGGGGSQSAGGTAATGGIASYSLPGALGVGGNYSSTGTLGGTAGGGGYYGGGSGHWGGGGGGGSSYAGGVTNGLTIMFGQPGFAPNPDTAGNGHIKITSMAPCTGTPAAGTASATTRNCASDPFTLSLSGPTTGGGITYQWQRSDSGANNFSNITGATSSFYAVTNQTTNSDYRCIVTCTNSSSSATSNVVNVTQIVAGNFFENFETTTVGSTTLSSIPSCWSFIDNVATTGYLYTDDTASSGPLSGSKYLRMYRTNSTANATQELVLVSPITDNLGNGTKQLRFYVRDYGTATSNNKIEVLSLSNTSNTTGAVVLATLIPSGTTYQEFIVPLPAGTNDYFGFRLAYNGTTTASNIAIDDVYYENLETCLLPTSITVTAVGQTTATLNWTASPSTTVTAYEYEVRSAGLPGSGPTGRAATAVINAPATTTNITGLSAITDYKVYVRSICGTTQGRWTVVSVDFTTLCDVKVNFYENFDTTTVGSTSIPSLPRCWNFIDDVGSTGYLYTHNLASSAPQSGANYVRMYRTNSTTNSTQELVMISPETNDLGNGAKQVRFSVKTYGTSATTYVNKLEILSMSSNTSTSGATVLATFTPNQVAYQEYVVQLPAGTNDYFGFRLAYNGVTTGSSVSIDDVYYEDIPAPTLTTTQTNNLCFGEANGMGSVVVKDGVMPLTYSWSPSGGTSATATGLAAGTYTVTITDALSRTATATVTITEPAQILSNSVITQISCNGSNNGSITIAPTGGTLPYTYLWNTGATGTSLSNLTPGVYSVTITDVNGCTGTESVTITEPVVLTATNSAQTDVSWYGGSDGSATVSVTGGTAPYTYSWSNGATGATATGLIAGTYTVMVTDANGCTSSLDFVIIQPIPLMVQSVSQTNVSCNSGTNGTATIVAMGGNAPYTYLWSNGTTNATAANLTAGVYTVTVTDSTGNIITESFTITEPAALASTMVKTDITCNFASNGTATVSVTGGTAPYTYFWSNGMTSATATNLNVGNYSVTITDANGCKTTATASITQPAALVATPSSTNITCYGLNDGTASVNVSGGTAPYTYSWSNGQTGNSLTSLGKGTYVVTITDANNCTTTQSFTITEPAFVYPPVAVNQSFCIGQNATLANMVITGSNIKWYSASIGGTLLPATTVLTNGTTYYASQTVGTCESATRTAVQVTLNQGTPLTTTQLNVCSNTRIQTMVVDGFNYTQLRWYSSATSTVQLASTQLLTTTTYYVSSLVGTCESPRQAIQVTVAALVPAPTASAQTACGNTTLNDLTVVKDPSATLRWYTSLQSMIPLAGTTQVSTGTFYVQQVIGACESVRVAVPVQVVTATVPTMTTIATCDGNTIADLHPSTGTYVWYVNNTTTTALPDSFVITSGNYYIAYEIQGCISSRVNVAVNVNARPGNATGQSNQLFGFAARVSDLQMNQPNVSWFASFNDAFKQVNQLAASHPLQDQTTYYGILTGANNCGSAVPAAVTVTINLSNAALDLTQLKYYPNPVDSELNISYIEEIKKVEVFTITGQRVFGNDYQGNEVKVDLSRLSAGTYLVKIETAKASQFVKIVKR